MALYRKKPVTIEAWQFDVEGGSRPPEWMMEAMRKGFVAQRGTAEKYYLQISALEGNMRADPGDWIIRGVRGELYPVKPDIFQATYEPVDG